MAGCGQWDMGDVEGDMAVPGGQDRKIVPWIRLQLSEPEPRGGVRGGFPLKAGVGVLHGNMHTLHALRPEASADFLRKCIRSRVSGNLLSLYALGPFWRSLGLSGVPLQLPGAPGGRESQITLRN